MDKDLIKSEIGKQSKPLAEALGLELVAVEVSGSSKNLKLAVFLDKPEGLTVEDCADFSRAIGDLLEESDLIPVGYTLEVSSPGLDRELKTLEDFKRFKGKLVKVRTRSALDGQRNFIGRLVDADAEKITVEDRTSGRVDLSFSIIAKANLEIDLDEELKRS